MKMRLSEIAINPYKSIFTNKSTTYVNPAENTPHVLKQAPDSVKQVSGVFISLLPVVLHARRVARPSFSSRCPHLYIYYRIIPFLFPFTHRAVGTPRR